MKLPHDYRYCTLPRLLRWFRALRRRPMAVRRPRAIA